MRKTRSVDIDHRLTHLTEKHIQLKQRVAELDRRQYLSIHEAHEKAHLKKVKLATKDAIEALVRSDGAS